MRRPLRIAFCHHASDYGGGSDRALFDLATHLPRDRVQPLMLLREGDPFAARYRAQDIAVEELQLKHPRRSPRLKDNLPFLLSFWPSVFALEGHIRRFEADLVHVNTLNNIQGSVAAWMAGRPLVWHIREIGGEARIDKLQRQAVRLLAHRVACMSDAIAAKQTLSGERVVVLRGAVDLAPYRNLPSRADARTTLGLDEEVKLVVCCGRIEHWKGQHVLIEAVPAIRKGHPTAQFWFAGAPAVNKPEYFEALRRQVAELGLQDCVRFLGAREDVPVLLAAADAAVAPTATAEPFGRVVIEGMAAGAPMISTDAGGPAETIEHGVTGLLAPPGEVKPLAAAISATLGQPDRARAMAENGRREALTKYDVSRLVEEALELFDELAEEHGAVRDA